jgi:voltage-gated potassium channel
VVRRGRRWQQNPSPRRGILISLPFSSSSPLRELGKRALWAVGILLINTFVVYFDRDSYSDNTNGDGLSFIDSLYYATVTITTTGYGDITPVSDHARLIGALVVTPLRIAFLILLVGTTVEVLANEGRRALRDARWRSRMRQHIVVLGYGTIGRSAVETLVRQGIPKEKIVIIDHDSAAVAEANRRGFGAFHGDVTSREVLLRSELPRAREVIITTNRDDTTILSTLTTRQLNPTAQVVAAVRKADNVPLLKQSGATQVITTSDSVGRLVGLASVNPIVGETMEDLLAAETGLEVVQRLVQPDEVGLEMHQVTNERILGIIRGSTYRGFTDPDIGTLRTGDELVVVRQSVPRQESQ